MGDTGAEIIKIEAPPAGDNTRITPSYSYAEEQDRPVGGALAVHAILAANIARQRTGEGRRVEVSLLDGQLFSLTRAGR